jgi:hypothetical protein
LPDLRGEFIRGADLGRGVNAGRTVGSFQADEIKTHRHDLKAPSGDQYYVINDENTTPPAGDVADGAFRAQGPDAANDGRWYPYTSYFGGSETRPRNVALIACIKAFGEIDEPDQILAANVLTAVNSIVGGVFGVNQSWIKYSAIERLFNVTYYNETPKPIMVNIGCYHLSASSYNEYYVNDVLVGYSTGQGAANQVGVGGTVSFVVPSRQTYKVLGGSKTTIATWAELR